MSNSRGQVQFLQKSQRFGTRSSSVPRSKTPSSNGTNGVNSRRSESTDRGTDSQNELMLTSGMPKVKVAPVTKPKTLFRGHAIPFKMGETSRTTNATRSAQPVRCLHPIVPPPSSSFGDSEDDDQMDLHYMEYLNSILLCSNTKLEFESEKNIYGDALASQVQNIVLGDYENASQQAVLEDVLMLSDDVLLKECTQDELETLSKEINQNPELDVACSTLQAALAPQVDVLHIANAVKEPLTMYELTSEVEKILPLVVHTSNPLTVVDNINCTLKACSSANDELNEIIKKDDEFQRTKLVDAVILALSVDVPVSKE